MKLKKFTLHDSEQVMKDSEMKLVLGGAKTGCEDKTASSCSGSCTIDGGYSGKCGWTKVWNRCTCGAGYIG